MRIITENEIVVQKGPNSPGMYSAATGKKKKIGGGIVDKAKGLVGSGKVQGALALFGNSNSAGQPSQIDTLPPPEPAKKGWSTGAKIGVGLGAATVLGLIFYFATRPKKGK